MSVQNLIVIIPAIQKVNVSNEMSNIHLVLAVNFNLLSQLL